MNDTEAKIFYSWQSDLPPKSNRYFIQDALKYAVKALDKAETDLEVRIDHDTKNLPGSPNIIGAVLTKISESKVFIADISLINSDNSENFKKTSNPNVLFELGYAVAKLGWNQVILVFNLYSGKVSDLPFDIRQHRVLAYNFNEEDRTQKLRELSNKLTVSIKFCLDWQPVSTNALTEMEIKNFQLSCDTKILLKMLETIHINTFDSFFHWAESAKIYSDIFWFFENFQAIVTGSDFYFHDRKLYSLVLDFYIPLSTSLELGGQYVVPQGGKVFSLTNHGEPDFEVDIKKFYSLINSARNAFQNLLRYIRERYLDVDIEKTSEIAFLKYESYKEFLRKQDLID